MDAYEPLVALRHQATLDRFVATCRADERVLAAFLGGSYARGTVDAHSDLDLYVITADETYAAFFAERTAFVRQFGAPVFLEDFDAYGFDLLLYIFADGVEGELALGRAGGFQYIHCGPYVVLLDKTGILARAEFPERRPSPDEQVERLHDLVWWFWHDLSHHFLTPLARGRLWTAVGALEALRRTGVDLVAWRQTSARYPKAMSRWNAWRRRSAWQTWRRPSAHHSARLSSVPLARSSPATER